MVLVSCILVLALIMLQRSTLQFLKNLKKNNNKPWFDAHRKDYDAARKDIELFIQQVIDNYGKKDKDIAKLHAKETMFRINRDIRFSKDKTPYKTNIGSSINKGGRKSMSYAGYYFHVEPGGKSFVGGGLYQPEPDVLRKVRQEIDYNYDAFKKIIGAKKFRQIYKDLDRSDEFLLSRVPKGYEPDNPAANDLRLKSFIAFVELKDEELTSKTLSKTVIAAFDALKPLNDFLNSAIQ